MAHSRSRSHSHLLLAEWERLRQIVARSGDVVLDGSSLHLAAIVAVARPKLTALHGPSYGASVSLSEKVTAPVEASSRFLQSSLERGDCIYGVNTGYGGSADVRTNDLKNLQRTVIRQLHYGIISLPANHAREAEDSNLGQQQDTTSKTPSLPPTTIPDDDPLASTTMPEAWVRASTLIRCNSLANGHSGVSVGLLQDLVKLLVEDVVPLIPLRGSISASGDLSPLSYLAAVIQGDPNVLTWHGPRSNGRELISADAALHKISMTPRDLGPKEGLAIVNGTAISAGVAALALYDAHHLALLSQICTAMGVEALAGTTESFDPFIASIRPHPGQVESSNNIRNFLHGSQLVLAHSTSKEAGVLRQDRYALRTSSQWLGPQLEDLLLAHTQIVTECNSTTDNPLIDVQGQKVIHGGNFQAQAITTAVEKIRIAAQKMGRMLFAQSTELVNPALNNGLPPNLVADEPSTSFVMKAVDLSTAAYMSELSFLANPVGTHIMSAELGNQSINSMALVSARYTHTALDVLSQLCAAYLYALCQALDLRALHVRFMKRLEPIFSNLVMGCFEPLLPSAEEELDTLFDLLWAAFKKELGRTTSMDASARFPHIFSLLQATIFDYPHLQLDAGLEDDESLNPLNLFGAIRLWKSRAQAISLAIFLNTREDYAKNPDATAVLGKASTRMYNFVRKQCGVPFLKRDFRPPPATSQAPRPVLGDFEEMPGFSGTQGTMMTSIYKAIRDGRMYGVAIECLKEAQEEEESLGAVTGSAGHEALTSDLASLSTSEAEKMNAAISKAASLAADGDGMI